MNEESRPNPSSRVRLGLMIFYVLCAILVVLDFLGFRHAENPLDFWWGFYPAYGFVSCVLLVVAATWMRKILMRTEDHYEKHEK